MHDVLFYNTPQGNEVVLDFLRAFAKDDRITLGADLRTVQMGFPIGLPVCGPLGDGLYEVRSSLAGGTEVRQIFFHSRKRSALVVVHAFVKKSRKTPKAALDLAKRRKDEYGP